MILDRRTASSRAPERLHFGIKLLDHVVLNMQEVHIKWSCKRLPLPFRYGFSQHLTFMLGCKVLTISS